MKAGWVWILTCRLSVVLLLLAVWVPARDTAACTCPTVNQAEFIGDSEFPQNGGPLVWTEPGLQCASATNGCAADVGVTVAGPAGEVPSEVVPPSSFGVPEPSLPIAPVFGIRADYQRGETYTITATANGETLSREFVVGPPVPERGSAELVVDERGRGEASNDCEEPRDGVWVQLRYTLDESHEAYRDQMFSWLEVNGRLHLPSGEGCDQLAPGEGRMGRGTQRLFLSCPNDEEIESVTGHVVFPLTGVQMSTEPVDVDLRCSGGCGCASSPAQNTVPALVFGMLLASRRVRRQR